MSPESRPRPVVYRPMTLIELAGHLAATGDDRHRWRLIAEFLEEYRHEPDAVRAALLADEPPGTGNERWDVFLAALAEHLATRDGRGVAAWAADRRLAAFWFPFNSAAARVDAVVHAPASFRSRGIFVAPGELGSPDCRQRAAVRRVILHQALSTSGYRRAAVWCVGSARSVAGPFNRA